jgi:SAM-dependent methyltransferase
VASDAPPESSLDPDAEQDFGDKPLEVRETDHYVAEYVTSFVEKWDELIDWDGRAEGEGDFYPSLLRETSCERILDAAAGTGYHSVQLAKAGFDILAADGAPEMVAKTLDNAATQGVDLPAQQADWRTLSDDVDGTFDALLCLGNAFTHLFDENERVLALEQFHKVLEPGGLVVIDQRNYDAILDQGFSSKHKYYYTGKGVDARPEAITEDYVRFRYTFPDGEVHHLTLCPIRQDYVTGLMADAGFRDIQRYGDFQADYDRYEPDFIVQVGKA